MGLARVLIANRGEVAIRIARTAAEMGLATVTVYSEDDAHSLHVLRADGAERLPGRGAAAYLDKEAILAAAERAGCDAIHPGYGFLSENAELARRAAERGLVFVGPAPETLELFGDKVRARAFAERCSVPVLPGTGADGGLEAACELLAALDTADGEAGAMIKAAAGGGGRGMRAVRSVEELTSEWPRCREEARRAFGRGDLYLERLVPRARHVEVQVAGDGTGAVVDFGERECSLQRRRQKIVEIAPAPNLAPELRARIAAAAVSLAKAARMANLGTFEFLVDEAGAWYFIEANPRLQVEHTVTEEITGVDLVRLQLALAGGGPLPVREPDAAPRGYAVQARVNLEEMRPDGTVRPAGGRHRHLRASERPRGPGRYERILRICPEPALRSADRQGGGASGRGRRKRRGGGERRGRLRGRRGQAPPRPRGVPGDGDRNQHRLSPQPSRPPEVRAGRLHTGFVEAHVADLLDGSGMAGGGCGRSGVRRYPGGCGRPACRARSRQVGGGRRGGGRAGRPGVRATVGRSARIGLRTRHGLGAGCRRRLTPGAGSGGREPGAVLAPMQGTVIDVLVEEGDAIHLGRELLVMEAMKMQHVIAAERTGRVRRLAVREGDTVAEGSPLLVLDEAEVEHPVDDAAKDVDLDAIRPDLAEVLERRALTRDERRPEAVARRRRTGQRTARENVADLVDPDSFIEYGALVLAARRQRHSMDDLIRRTPADGLVAGVGRVNGHLFDDERARCLVMAYDYTVLAGTQGKFNHHKKDRMFALAEQWRLPMVFFTEGGGGRPGDTDIVLRGRPAHPRVPSPRAAERARAPRRHRLRPLLRGECGGARLLRRGDRDPEREHRDGRAGDDRGRGARRVPARGGRARWRCRCRTGVVDLPVADEAEAVAAAKRYLSYFQGAVGDWACADQRRLRHLVPEDRLRVYDVRRVVELLADDGSVLELKRGFGPGMVTALVRIEGRPIGVVANNPIHLAGAVDSDGADKAAHFMQICDAFDIPILCLCDTPGNMVGPEAEKTALVRHCCRLYVIGRKRHRADVHRGAAQVLRARRPGDGGGELPRPVLRRLLADRGVRRDGPSRARSSSGTATSWPRSTTPRSGWPATRRWWPRCTSRGRRSTPRPCSRSTT